MLRQHEQATDGAMAALSNTVDHRQGMRQAALESLRRNHDFLADWEEKGRIEQSTAARSSRRASRASPTVRRPPARQRPHSSCSSATAGCSHCCRAGTPARTSGKNPERRLLPARARARRRRAACAPRPASTCRGAPTSASAIRRGPRPTGLKELYANYRITVCTLSGGLELQAICQRKGPAITSRGLLQGCSPPRGQRGQGPGDIRP